MKDSTVQRLQREAIERHRRLHNEQVTRHEQAIVDRYMEEVKAFVAAQPRYVVKCDECKAVIRRTDSLGQSAAGGMCDACRSAAMREP